MNGKKIIKYSAISLLSIILLISITVGAVIWVVFTPEKLTPIVKEQVDKIFKCQTDFKDVELTFYSTFPNITLQISDILVINPMEGTNDTLLSVKKVNVGIDIMALYNNNDIIVKELKLKDGFANAYIDSLGNTNFDIIESDTTTVEKESSESPFINAESIEIENFNLSYVDKKQGMSAQVNDMNLTLTASIDKNKINSSIDLSNSVISFQMGKDKYLKEVPVKLNVVSELTQGDNLAVALEKAMIVVGNIDLNTSGNIIYYTKNGDIDLDVLYTLNLLDLEQTLKLVPDAFKKDINGIKPSGNIALKGSAKGMLTKDQMPFVDAVLTVNGVGVKKFDKLPVDVSDVNGEFIFKSDLKTDAVSSLKISSFSARTGNSSISASGMVTQIFSDLKCDLSLNTDVVLDELNILLPKDLKTHLSGKLNGKTTASFTLSQIEKMDLDKIKASGNFDLSTIDVKYDKMYVNTDATQIHLQLPNKNASSDLTKFAYAKVVSGNLHVWQADSFDVKLNKVDITLETSDVRDTLVIPSIICNYDIHSIDAQMDTMGVSLQDQVGEVKLSPRSVAPKQPKIFLNASMGLTKANTGKTTLSFNSLKVKTDIENKQEYKDVVAQWPLDGFFEIENVNVTLANSTHKIQVPSIKMNLEKEIFNIKESRLIVDNSDFNLSGQISNIYSYFKGDSILRGKLDFTSSMTNVSELMALTSGMESGEAETKTEPATEKSSGPFMVPLGVDLTLNTNVKKAIYEKDTATNISGDITIKNGKLVLGQLKLTTPATRMLVTAIYESPRKNHLFLGIDYHMLDIEISALLNMIPDVDSLMPMLRSFGGKAEYNMVVETNLDSLYNPKKSTILGKASITGKDLVLMDGETFAEIAKMLLFKRKTKNKVDTLAAEFTMHRNVIQIYPFYVGMDKYGAVVAGKHNVDMSFDYDISLIKSPIPACIGVTVSGNLDDIQVKKTKGGCTYPSSFRPIAKNEIANKRLELRNLIRQSLVAKE